MKTLTNPSNLQTFIFAVCLSCSVGMAGAATNDFKSPSGSVSIQLELVEGVPSWSATYDGVAVLNKSPIEIEIGGNQKSFRDSSFDAQDRKETFQLTWGQFKEVEDHHREVTWRLKSDGSEPLSLSIVARIYDDAIAFRILGENLSAKMADRFSLHFADDYNFWAANGERPNHGPMPLSTWEAGKPLQAPMTVAIDESHYLAVLEAGIYAQYPFHLVHSEGTRYHTANRPCDFGEGVAETSWRVVSFGRTPGDLITNQILYKLNKPSAIKDTTWIKPGFTLWDWRAWGATADDGFQYGLDMESWRRFIDFAAEKENVRYLMLDANWYGPEFSPDSDPTTSRDHVVKQTPDGKVVREAAPEDWEPIDVPAIIEYGKQRGVGIILYFNDKARKKYDFDKTLATYERWGAAGIKYGFMATGGNKKVEQTRYIVQKCAEHQLICDFHDGPIPGSGDARTYPNYLAREFCHAQADAKRSFSPSHFCTTVFVNMLTGSLDMANGLYAIKGAEKNRPRIFEKVETTVVGETARTLINFGALSILPDIPEAYEAKADLFRFIETMPLTWDETRVLHGEIGKRISIARRSGNSWWIGTACNEDGGEVLLELPFLNENVEYTATIFSDGATAHYQENPEIYRVDSQVVRKGDSITAQVAPGGGHCVLLEAR